MIYTGSYHIAVEGMVYKSRLWCFVKHFLKFEITLDLKPRCEVVGYTLFIL